MATLFSVEHWQRAGGSTAGNGPTPQFFFFKITGPKGVWPAKAYIIPPGWSGEEEDCILQGKQLDLEIETEAFLEIECTVEDPLPGEYFIRLIVNDEHLGDFRFELVPEQSPS